MRNRRKLLESPLSLLDYTLKGKGWVIHNWGVVRTCVGILRVSIGMSFWGVSDGSLLVGLLWRLDL